MRHCLVEVRVFSPTPRDPLLMRGISLFCPQRVVRGLRGLLPNYPRMHAKGPKKRSKWLQKLRKDQSRCSTARVGLPETGSNEMARAVLRCGIDGSHR